MRKLFRHLGRTALPVLNRMERAFPIVFAERVSRTILFENRLNTIKVDEKMMHDGRIVYFLHVDASEIHLLQVLNYDDLRIMATRPNALVEAAAGRHELRTPSSRRLEP